MAVTTELITLRRTVDELRAVVGSVRGRYGDIAAVRRLLNDIDRIDLDASELDDLTPLPLAPPAASDEAPIVLDDTPLDPSLWHGADDEGLGGYQR
jgi:hypothetical protein